MSRHTRRAADTLHLRAEAKRARERDAWLRRKARRPAGLVVKTADGREGVARIAVDGTIIAVAETITFELHR